jgi:hypothetical protein
MVEAGPDGGTAQPLAPPLEPAGHGRRPAQGLPVTLGPVPSDVAPDGSRRLLEPPRHHRRPHVGQPQPQQLLDVRLQRPLQLPVPGQHLDHGLDQVEVVQPFAQPDPAVGQHDPAPPGVAGQRHQNPIRHDLLQQPVQLHLERRLRPGRLQPHHAPGRGRPQHRRPWPQVRLGHLPGPPDPPGGQLPVQPRLGLPPPVVRGPRCDRHAGMLAGRPVACQATPDPVVFGVRREHTTWVPLAHWS